MGRLSVNDEAPDFTLEDLSGQSFRLSELRGRSNVLLVFNRGFLWPFCRRHLAQLRQDTDAIRGLRTEIVVIGPEDARAFVEYWERERLPFTGLPDPTRGVLRLYGQEVKPLRWGRMPAQAIIDLRGTVRYIHYGASMKDIPENREILLLLGGLQD